MSYILKTFSSQNIFYQSIFPDKLNLINCYFFNYYNSKIKFLLSENDILFRKDQNYDDEIFDHYYFQLSDSDKKNIFEEMKTKIEDIININKIILHEFSIDINDKVEFTKKDLEMIKNKKIELKPQALLNFESKKTNIDTDIIVKLIVKIEIHPDIISSENTCDWFGF